MLIDKTPAAVVEVVNEQGVIRLFNSLVHFLHLVSAKLAFDLNCPGAPTINAGLILELALFR